MDFDLEVKLCEFMNSKRDAFYIDEFYSHCKEYKKDIKRDEVAEFLKNEKLVFPGRKSGKYIPRQYAFKNLYFSFPLTQREIEQQAFVVGDRVVPFLNGENNPCSFVFSYAGKPLERTAVYMDFNTAINCFTLYGGNPEHFIASDWENFGKECNLETCQKVALTALSLKPLIAKFKLKAGDRILCRVVDWTYGYVQIEPVLNHEKNPFLLNSENEERQRWNERLEEALLKSFYLHGPCCDIEQQLGLVFYENGQDLCNRTCGSFYEFLNWTKKVSIEDFGVEMRLWRKGEDVPAVGTWNRESVSPKYDSGIPFFYIPDFLFDNLIYDALFKKKKNICHLLEDVLPESMRLSNNDRIKFTLQIISRSVILLKDYNWFADFHLGNLRHTIIGLYSKVGNLVYEIGLLPDKLESFPQQELITLDQLFSHICCILEVLETPGDVSDDELMLMNMSLEGMEACFEDIRGCLTAAVERFNADKFKII